LWAVARRDGWAMRVAIVAGSAVGASIVAILLINYVNTGLPQDQLTVYLWDWIDWKEVVQLGYTLELYSQMRDHSSYLQVQPSLLASLSTIIVEYFRLYLLWPLLAVGLALAVTARRAPGIGIIGLFLLASLLCALFLGGRSQPISYFRFSTFNYAPMLLACLLLWGNAAPRLRKYAISFFLLALLPWIYFRESQVVGAWYQLGRSAVALNTGAYSLRDAVGDQHGRVGRLRWGGVYPPMEEIYAAMPAGTRIWSLHNHSYCLLPACNMQMYFAQVTSPRWYDIALGSVAEGKKIMQAEGLNFIFYSRSVPVVGAADAQDALAGFYKGLAPENIGKTFGILWTNGWDYLLTWKEESSAPLDAEFIDSWRLYYKDFVLPRQQHFQLDKLAVMVKKAAEDPSVIHPPRPEW
jgi:hypothetical protein